jgi:protoporphyrinogen oxidase
MTSTPRILIIGAGPTGLGAAYRLQQLGYDNWVILEANGHVGGLATSFTDPSGFTFDIGGHVLFSHYSYYTKLINTLLGDAFVELGRDAWIWMDNRFIPYPFQLNLSYLEPQKARQCVDGFLEAQRQTRPFSNFAEWIHSVFGAGIADQFMIPYNSKVWATPLEKMGCGWMGERVAVADPATILQGAEHGAKQPTWGPNATFRYPLRGGTGFVWRALQRLVEDHLHLETAVSQIDMEAQKVHTTSGKRWGYDVLLNTMPLNRLVRITKIAPNAVRSAAETLMWTASHIVGVGVDRPASSSKTWIYFPEAHVPFHRVTFLSNYSPYMTPQHQQTSFLAEISHSPYARRAGSHVVSAVLDGLVSTGLMTPVDRNRRVLTTWLCSPPMSYPVPSMGRDHALRGIEAWLRSHRVYSRGRFGAWLYEIGNMDHSTMQGVEFVNHILFGDPEWTWEYRSHVHAPQDLD